MMGSAQLEILPEDEGLVAPAGAEGNSALKQEVSARLSAHRERRMRMDSAAITASVTPKAAGPRRQNAVAMAVAERYAQTPSYRAFLAEEAERAIQEAAAAAVVAQRTAKAVAAAQGELLAELQKYDAPVKFEARTAEVTGPGLVVVAPAAPAPERTELAAAVKEVTAAGLTVRLYEDLARPRVAPVAAKAKAPQNVLDEATAQALEEEISFRQAPVFEDYRGTEPTEPLPANLLEFPRQLVAPVKARARLAEGPLLDEEKSSQLRIFEVEADQSATIEEPISLIPEWSSIWLDAHVATEPVMDPNAPGPELMASLLPPQTAPMQLRVMAAVVDGLLVLGGFVAFIAAAAKMATGIALTLPLLGAAAAVLALMYVGYQMLFFTLSGQTPGMRYSRIGLCTFSDENPSRSAMRKRVLAQVVAVAPMGLGVAWALIDDDRLGWHDRMSRMYQRAY